MRALSVVVLVVALASAHEAFAIKGTYLNDREFPANVCKIGFYSRGGSGDPDEVCSGTLIAKNRVITAAHCDANLADHPDAYVKCGRAAGLANFNFGTSVKGHIKAPWYTREVGLHDLAVFELDGELDGPYVPLVESLQQSQDLQQSLSACRVFGFGKDNYNRLGTPHGAQFTPVTAANEQRAYSITTGPNRAAPGDSGGPVLCPVTANGGTQWVQLAVTISIPADQHVQISWHELLETHLEWLRGVMNTPSLPRIDR